MKEEWLLHGAVVPVDVETTSALVAEIHRLIGVVGGMALAQPPQRTWVGLEKSDMPDGADPLFDDPKYIAGMVYAANKLMEKNA